MYEVDDLDRDIVLLLKEDGRMPSAEIARRLGGIPERTVRHRIDRLIREGVIQIRPIVNPSAVGLTVTADVWVQVETGHALEVARRLAELQEVSYVACSIGDRDLSLQVNVSSNQELYRFVSDVIGKVPWVKSTSIVVVPMVLKDVYDWTIPDSALTRSTNDASGYGRSPQGQPRSQKAAT